LPDPSAAIVEAGYYLQSVSREVYRGSALHFGKQGVNRYDDPACGYGVMYLAFDLATGLMETVFRNHRWWRAGAKRSITWAEVQRRMVRIVRVEQDVRLCDLVTAGAAAQAFGLTGAQLSLRNYRATRALSARIVGFRSASGESFDGILYPSRNNPGARCIALFEQARAKVELDDDVRLDDHAQWPAFIREFDVSIGPR
jgi:hypothetical protein